MSDVMDTTESGVLQRIEAGFVVNERYEITKRLGAGGFAVVFLGRDLQIERDVAIKVMNTSETVTDPEVHDQLLERFRREASLAGRIDHPNVLNIYDYGIVDGEDDPFIVMEHLQGHDLEKEIRDHGAMEPEHVLPLFADTLVALGVAHEHGIVHKDLKPSNLFLKRPGTRLEALCILDFGIAHIEREVRNRLTQAGQLMGTPAYLPPEYSTEQIVTPMLDVYQMGLILVEVLAGEAVVQHSEPMAAMFQHVQGSLEVPKPLMQSPLGPILQRALALEHEDRFSDGLEFADALAAISPESIPHLHGDFEQVELASRSPEQMQRALGMESSSSPDDSTGSEPATDASESDDVGANDSSETQLAYGGQGRSERDEQRNREPREHDDRKATGGDGQQPAPTAKPAEDDADDADDDPPKEPDSPEGPVPQLQSRLSTEEAERQSTLEMERSSGTTPRTVGLIVATIVAGILVGGGFWLSSGFSGGEHADGPDEQQGLAGHEEPGEGDSAGDDDASAPNDDEDEQETGDDDDETQPSAVDVVVESDPTTAGLYDGEDKLGETPVELTLEEGEVIDASLRLDGYQEKDVELSADIEQTPPFVLDAKESSEEVASVGAPPDFDGAAQEDSVPPDDDDPDDDSDPAPAHEESSDAQVDDEEPTEEDDIEEAPDDEESIEEDDIEEDDIEEDDIEEDDIEEAPDDEESIEEEPIEEDEDDDNGEIRLPGY